VHLTPTQTHKKLIPDKPIPPKIRLAAIDSCELIDGTNPNVSIGPPTIRKKKAIHNFHDCPDRTMYESENINYASY